MTFLPFKLKSPTRNLEMHEINILKKLMYRVRVQIDKYTN